VIVGPFSLGYSPDIPHVGNISHLLACPSATFVASPPQASESFRNLTSRRLAIWPAVASQSLRPRQF